MISPRIRLDGKRVTINDNLRLWHTTYLCEYVLTEISTNYFSQHIYKFSPTDEDKEEICVTTDSTYKLSDWDRGVFRSLFSLSYAAAKSKRLIFLLEDMELSYSYVHNTIKNHIEDIKRHLDYLNDQRKNIFTEIGALLEKSKV